MNKRKSPASGKRQGLDNGFDRSNSSIKLKGMNHQKTLQAIANKWVERRCYDTLDRALRALIGGDL